MVRAEASDAGVMRSLAPGRQEPRNLPAPPPLHRPPRRALRHAAADPRVRGAVVHRDWSGAAERPVGHRARRVRGDPPAVPILVRGPVTGGGWPVTPGPTASRQDAGGQPGVHPASPQPAPLRLRSAGEGWAAGPSRRDAKRPSGGRRSRRDSRRCGGGCCRQGSVRGDCCGGPSPHTVRRWSAKRPKSANDSRERPSVKVLVKYGFQSQPTAPSHPSVDFARRVCCMFCHRLSRRGCGWLEPAGACNSCRTGAAMWV
jgi:hypothetical protein